MKKIINGLRYDTDSSDVLGRGEANCPCSDFGWWQAELYRTPKSKRYFLAGNGGPMTSFSHPANGGGRGGGERIIPMTVDAAREWAEQNLSVEEVEAAFAEQIEDA